MADFLRKFEKETALVLDICDLRDLTVAIGNKTPFPVPQLNVLLKFHLGKLFLSKTKPILHSGSVVQPKLQNSFKICSTKIGP